jgi:SAM-dependent methyltransferase
MTADPHHDHHGSHAHHGSHDEPDGSVSWEEMAASIELQGEVLISLLDQAIAVIADEARRAGLEVRRIVDLGSGPGVGSTALARAFVQADVVAVDGSAAMASRAEARFDRLGLAGRVTVETTDLPVGLAELGPADLVWAAMVMHHLGDERSTLGAIRSLLDPGGLVALLEFGDPMRFLPDSSPGDQPGLLERLDARNAEWVATMRAALPDATASDDYPTMLAATGFEVVADRLLTTRLEAPLDDAARQVIANHLGRARLQAEPGLDAADLAALDGLLDPDSPQGIGQRDDLVLEWSRHLYLARATTGTG